MPETPTKPPDRRSRAHPQGRFARDQAVVDNIAAAWTLAESGYRTDDGSSVPSNRARAVEHLEAAIAAIRGGER